MFLELPHTTSFLNRRILVWVVQRIHGRAGLSKSKDIALFTKFNRVAQSVGSLDGVIL